MRGHEEYQEPDRACAKRLFASKRHAREAHAKAHWRIRPYYCRACRGWHVTNQEKG